MKLMTRFLILFWIFSLPAYVMETNSRKIQISSPTKDITVKSKHKDQEKAKDKENILVIKNKYSSPNLGAFYLSTNSLKLNRGRHTIKFNLNLEPEEKHSIQCVIKFKPKNIVVESQRITISPGKTDAELDFDITEDLETQLFIHFYQINYHFKEWKLTNLSWSTENN